MPVKKMFPIDLDAKRSTSTRSIEVVEGDNGNVLEITLTDDGTAVDLANCLICAMFARPDGGTAQQDNGGHGITMDAEENNKFSIDLYTTSFSPGLVECEIQIYSGEDHDTLITTAKFNFSCRRGIVNEETIQATDEYPLLVKLMNRCEDVEEAEELRVTAEGNRAAAETARAIAETDRETAETTREALKTKLLSPSATATSLPVGASPTATAEITDNGIVFSFGLVPGDSAEAHAAQHATGGSDPVTAASIGAATVTGYTAALASDGWVGASAPYTQTVNVTGVTADMQPIVDIVLSATQATAETELEDSGKVSKIETAAGSITATCFTDKPTVALNLQMKVVK